MVLKIGKGSRDGGFTGIVEEITINKEGFT